MRKFFIFTVIFLVSFNIQAAPKDQSSTATNDMFFGYYYCSPGTTEPHKTLNIAENTYVIC